MIDFNKTSNVLIAGSKCSGKTCLLNTLICSLLLNNNPDQFHLTLFDLKQVEFSKYSPLTTPKPYLKEPQVKIINQIDDSIDELKRLDEKMDAIYKKFVALSVSKIDEFNALSKEKLPYEFIIIDEYADLLLANQEAAKYLIRIAQKGRACGYHLILATAKINIKTIISTLKANRPITIALQVIDPRESIFLLGHYGAESLLGKGDAMIQSPNSIFEVRVQTAYISDEEIEKIVDWWTNFSDNEKEEK